MHKPRNRQDLYLVTTCRDTEISETTLTQEEYAKLDPTNVDFSWDEASGRISIQPKIGDRIEHTGSIPGTGPDGGEKLLLEMMYKPGQLLSLRHVMRPLGLVRIRIDRKMRGIISAHLCRIRKAFGETADLPWFLVTTKRPFRFGWNGSASWRTIERVAQSDDLGDLDNGEE